MALHSAQGPKLGIPQMIQSRAQFGVIGAIFPLILVVVMYTGFFALTSVLGGEALSNLSVPLTPSIIIVNLITLIIAIYGYKLIHSVEKYLSIASSIFYLILTIAAFSISAPEGLMAFGDVNWGVFMLTVSIYASWLLAFAPYVADYSRYLPEDISPSKVIWSTYLGSGIATTWMMVLGAYLAAVIPGFDANASYYLSTLLGENFSSLVYLMIVVGVIGANVFNVYGGFLSIVTTLEPFTKIRGTVKTKIVIMTLIFLFGNGIAILGQGDFLASFSSFLVFLLYFLIPWTAINLVDYYFVCKGIYSIDAMFDLNGQYGRINWKTIIVFIISVLAQIPFINASFYQGPISLVLNGADIAWLIGLIVPSVLYYALNRKSGYIVKETVNEEVV